MRFRTVLHLRGRSALLALMCCLWTSVLAAPASPRLALIVTNSAYPIARLSSPSVDASVVEDKLRSLGFAVEVKQNLTRQQFKAAVRDFGSALSKVPGSSGIFYYSGHGMQVNGINYLIPIDSSIENEVDVESEAVRLDEVILRMQSANSRPNVIILDACRNNPFEKKFKGIEGGLAKPEAPPGTIIAFAAAPGSVAPQAFNGAASPYTAALVKQLASDVPLILMFQQVANDVYEQSGGLQRPHVETSAGVDANFYLSRFASPNFAPPHSVPAGPMRASILLPAEIIDNGRTALDKAIAERIMRDNKNRLPEGSHIDVFVSDGKILLTGEVPDSSVMSTVVRIAKNDPDARSVVTDLEIAAATNPSVRAADSRLAQEVRGALSAALGARTGGLYSIIVSKAVVYLMGRVTQQEGSAAAEIALRVNGIAKVVKVFDYLTEAEAEALRRLS